MAGIVTVIYSAFFTASQSVQQAETMRDSTDLVRTLVSKLSDDIANAYVNPGMNYPNAPLTVFYGKKVEPSTGTEKSRRDELYLTTLTNWRGRGTQQTDLCEVGYYFKEGSDGKGYIMMRREKRLLSKDSPALELEGSDEYPLTDRVKSLQFRYKSSSTSTWSDEWSVKTALPKIVAITLLLDDGSVYVTEVQVLNGPPA